MRKRTRRLRERSSRERIARSRRHVTGAWHRVLYWIWGSAVEPRSVTALTALAYLVTAILGYSLLLAPPTGHENDVWIRTITAVCLIGGGTVGVPTAWRGAWWLEQTASAASGAGMIIALTEVMAVHDARGLATPWVTVLGLVLAALFWFARFSRVKDWAYAPGKGPLLPEQRAAVREVLDATVDDALNSSEG